MDSAGCQTVELIARLTRIRGTVRRRLFAYGVCTVLAGGIAAFLTVVLLDWLLWLPAGLRLFGALLYLVGFIVCVWHWLARPLGTPITLEAVASELEHCIGHLHDRLSSTVNFLKESDAGADAMRRHVVTRTDRAIEGIELESALSMRPLAARAGLLAALSLLFAAVIVAAPNWTRIGLSRYLYPFGQIEWPRTVQIVPITGDTAVAMGESVTVRMQIVRGQTDALRSVVHLREPDGHVVRLTMQRQQPAALIAGGDSAKRVVTFYTTIDAVTQELSYWFEAGDDSTVATPFVIRAVRRPEVVSAIATVTAPPYAGARPPRVHDLRDANVEVPVGGTVVLAIRASKPIPPDVPQARARLEIISGFAGLLMLDGDGASADVAGVPLTVDPDDHLQLGIRFALTDSVVFRIELTDADGFESVGGTQVSLDAVPDAPPTAAITEPRSVVELTPRGSLSMSIDAADDFGLTKLELVLTRLGARSSASPDDDVTIALTEALVITSEPPGVRGRAEHQLSIKALGLDPGDVLVCRAVATDNRHHINSTATGGGASLLGEPWYQDGESATLRIRIISDLEFDIRLRDELAILEARVRRTLIDQMATLDQTEALARSTAVDGDIAPDPFPPAARERAGALAANQSRLALGLLETVRRLDKMIRRIELNAPTEGAGLGATEDDRKALEATARATERIATEAMRAAGEALRASAELLADGGARSEQSDQSEDLLANATTMQQQAVEQLQAVLRAMAQRGDFQTVVTKTRDLLDRQRAVRSQTHRVGAGTLGKSVESLSEKEAAALARLQRKQDQIGADVRELLARMRQLAELAKKKDPAGAEALDAAVRAATARDLVRRLSGAVKAIGENRTAAAALDQRQAEDAIRKMAAALSERETRRLAQLRKSLAHAEQQVAELIEDLTALRAATDEIAQIGGDSNAMGELADRQRVIRRNTRALADEIAQVGQAVAAASLVRRSAGPMGEAQGFLRAEQPRAAIDGQDTALALLNEAREDLRALAQEAFEAAQMRSLARIRTAIELIAQAQAEINTGIGVLRKAVGQARRRTRAQSREASRLARAQSGALELVEELRPELAEVVVYDWVLARVAKWMIRTRAALDDRLIDDDLVATADRIAFELSKLIRAIDQMRDLPTPTQFVEAGGGSGAKGSAQERPPVPKLVELLVIKEMQSDVWDRTKRLGATFDRTRATEAQLRELQMIGEDQESVRRLTELVTRRARHP